MTTNFNEKIKSNLESENFQVCAELPRDENGEIIIDENFIDESDQDWSDESII